MADGPDAGAKIRDPVVMIARPAAVLMTLDPEVLADTARDRVTRTFTAEECATYDIDPCPVPAEAA